MTGITGSLYGFGTINGSRRAYLTYGGGPEGGIVRLRSSVTSAALWYVWHPDWGRPASILRIPRELTPVSRHEDGYEAIKLVMADDYELGDDEHYLDDMEDTVDEDDDSEYGMRNDDDDEANEGREDDDEASEGPQEDNIEIEANERDLETEAEDEVEDEADNMQAFMNNERRGEIASL